MSPPADIISRLRNVEDQVVFAQNQYGLRGSFQFIHLLTEKGSPTYQKFITDYTVLLSTYVNLLEGIHQQGLVFTTGINHSAPHAIIVMRDWDALQAEYIKSAQSLFISNVKELYEKYKILSRKNTYQITI